MSLSYVFAVANFASLFLTGLAGRTMMQSTWNKEDATASVISEQKKSMPKGTTQAVELLRFVTAYKKGVEALVDITPYSALLSSAAETDGDLTFFAFIDTWVGNSTAEAHPIMSLDDTGKCAPSTRQQDAWGGGGHEGNGWQLDVDMVFWPRVSSAVDTRPRESITISSGYYGSYSIGGITTHEGTITKGGAGIELNEGADFTGTLDAEVYPCPGGAQDVEHGLKMGNYGQQVAKKRNNSAEIQSIIKEVYDQLVGDSMTTVSAVNSPKSQNIEVTCSEDMQCEEGMPVWYEKDDLEVQNGSQRIGQFPGTAIGSIMTVVNATGKIVALVKMNGTCVPGPENHFLPRLRMEKRRGALALARQSADSIGNLGAQQMQGALNTVALLAQEQTKTPKAYGNEAQGQTRLVSSDDEGELIFRPPLVGRNKDNNYAWLQIVGQLDLEFLKGTGDVAPADITFSLLQTSEEETAQTEKNVKETKGNPKGNVPTPESVTTPGSSGALTNTPKDGEKVCILARRSTGRVFERTFDLPTFNPAVTPAGPTVVTPAGHTLSPDTDTGPTVVTPAGFTLSPDKAASSPADRVLLQFAVTGHGWSGSTEQCGEFCHAVYHINVNGVNAANVTEWRDDCEKNPISDQQGTWEIHRDGWCPGSVEPGLYIDMTKWLKNGRGNTISVDLSVWSSTASRYEKYTNYGSYLGGGDGAVLFVGATLFIYDGEAVEAIKGQEKAYTAAEMALRTGNSAPDALKPPHQVNSAFGSLLQLTAKAEAQPSSKPTRVTGVQQPSAYRSDSHEKTQPQKHLRQQAGAKHPSFLQQGTDPRYNYPEVLNNFPWFQIPPTSESQWRGDAQVVPAFKDGLIQINTREIRVKVKRESLPKDWERAALRVRLEKPDGMELDNWDRVGSLGIVFEENAKSTTDPNSKLKLKPSDGKALTKSWKLGKLAKQ